MRTRAGAVAAVMLLMTLGNPSIAAAQAPKPAARPAPAIPQLSGILEQRGRGNTPPADWVGALTTRAKAIIAAFDDTPRRNTTASLRPRPV